MKSCKNCARFKLESHGAIGPWGRCHILPSGASSPFWLTPQLVHGDMHGQDCDAWVSHGDTQPDAHERARQYMLQQHWSNDLPEYAEWLGCPVETVAGWMKGTEVIPAAVVALTEVRRGYGTVQGMLKAARDEIEQMRKERSNDTTDNR